MRGVASWLNRDLVYTVTDTADPDFSETYTVLDASGVLTPDWGVGYGKYSGGMSVPGAWRAATMRADQLAKFPWHLYRSRGDGTSQRLRTPILLEQPAPPFTRMTTFAALALDLVWHGNAIALVASRDAAGWPTALLPVDADRVEVGRNPQGGRLVYRIDGDQQKTYDQADVLHVMGHSRPGDLRGMGVLEQHLKWLQASAGLARQANNVQHGVPTGVLEGSDPDVTPEELATGKRDWLQAQSTRTIAALPPGVKFTPISWNPEQMQLVEARKFDLATCALIFGIPGYWLGAESNGFTYSSAEWEGRNLLKYTAVGADVVRFEQAMTGLFPRGQYVQANPDAILRGSTQERYAAHEIGVRAGFLEINEVRVLEDLPIFPVDPPSDPEVTAALQLAKAAPSLVQNPGLPALVDQLRFLAGKAPSVPPAGPPAEPSEEPTDDPTEPEETPSE